MSQPYVININLPGSGLVDVSEITASLTAIAADLKQLKQNQRTIMASIQNLQDDLAQIKKGVGDYIAQRDATDATLQQQINDLLAQHVTDAQSLSALQAGVDSAFADAEAAKALLTPPAPTGGTTGSTDTTGSTGSTDAGTGSTDTGSTDGTVAGDGTGSTDGSTGPT